MLQRVKREREREREKEKERMKRERMERRVGAERRGRNVTEGTNEIIKHAAFLQVRHARKFPRLDGWFYFILFPFISFLFFFLACGRRGSGSRNGAEKEGAEKRKKKEESSIHDDGRTSTTFDPHSRAPNTTRLCLSRCLM